MYYAGEPSSPSWFVSFHAAAAYAYRIGPHRRIRQRAPIFPWFVNHRHISESGAGLGTASLISIWPAGFVDHILRRLSPRLL